MNVPRQFENPIEIDSRYSTTRRLYRKPPNIKKTVDNKTPYGLFADSQATGLPGGGLRRRGFFKHSIPGLPLITVITVVYNGDNYLKQTLKSVIDQSYQNVEYIVIDGASSDNTLEIISRYESAIDYWLSEPDKGIADAMNKGIALSTGDFVIFLHADDYFADDRSLEKSVKSIEDSDEIIACDILYGKALSRLTSRGFNFWMNFKTGIYHQGALCSRNLLLTMRGFDTRFKIAMDYDFFLRIYQSGIHIKKIPLVLTIMRDTGISAKTDWRSLQQRFSEEKKVHAKNCRSLTMEWLYGVYWLLYIPYRKIKLKI